MKSVRLQSDIKLGKEIQFYRELIGLGQLKLADAIEVHWATISRWENGKGSLRMSLETFIKLMRVLKIDADMLIGGIKL